MHIVAACIIIANHIFLLNAALYYLTSWKLVKGRRNRHNEIQSKSALGSQYPCCALHQAKCSFTISEWLLIHIAPGEIMSIFTRL